jgi:hypothetical protein
MRERSGVSAVSGASGVNPSLKFDNPSWASGDDLKQQICEWLRSGVLGPFWGRKKVFSGKKGIFRNFSGDFQRHDLTMWDILERKFSTAVDSKSLISSDIKI